MACEFLKNHRSGDDLSAFLDGELPAAEERPFEEHLRSCADCAAEATSHVRLKIAVKRTGKRFAPSTEFRRKIETQILPRERTWLAAWIPTAVAVAAVILIAMFWFSRGTASRQAGAAIGEIIDAHIATLASANPVDVISTDQHTVKPWFEGKLPFGVNLPDLKNTPFTLLGGRVTYLHQHPGAALLFQFRKHRLSVFVFQDRPQWKNIGSPGTTEQHASFWVESWSAGGLRYFVVADTSAANVEQLSRLMRSATLPE